MTTLQRWRQPHTSRATDKAGNVSAVDTGSWTVVPPPDTTAPVVNIAAVGTLGASAKFTLSANEPAVTFTCQLTTREHANQPCAACKEAKTYVGMKSGSYVLSVCGTDAAGNHSQVVTKSWTVSKGAHR